MRMTTAEVAETLGVGVRRVRQLFAAGAIPATRDGGDWRVSRRAVAQYLAASRRAVRGRRPRGRPRKVLRLMPQSRVAASHSPFLS